LYLTNPADKALIQKFVKELKTTKPEIFADLRKYKLVDAKGNLARNWAGPKGVKFLQIMLNHLIGANLKVDGAYGPNTFWALVQYQKQSNVYKSTTLRDVQAFANQNNL
jgi:lysozyme family protein